MKRGIRMKFLSKVFLLAVIQIGANLVAMEPKAQVYITNNTPYRARISTGGYYPNNIAIMPGEKLVFDRNKIGTEVTVGGYLPLQWMNPLNYSKGDLSEFSDLSKDLSLNIEWQARELSEKRKEKKRLSEEEKEKVIEEFEEELVTVEKEKEARPTELQGAPIYYVEEEEEEQIIPGEPSTSEPQEKTKSRFWKYFEAAKETGKKVFKTAVKRGLPYFEKVLPGKFVLKVGYLDKTEKGRFDVTDYCAQIAIYRKKLWKPIYDQFSDEYKDLSKKELDEITERVANLISLFPSAAEKSIAGKPNELYPRNFLGLTDISKAEWRYKPKLTRWMPYLINKLNQLSQCLPPKESALRIVAEDVLEYSKKYYIEQENPISLAKLAEMIRKAKLPEETQAVQPPIRPGAYEVVAEPGVSTPPLEMPPEPVAGFAPPPPPPPLPGATIGEKMGEELKLGAAKTRAEEAMKTFAKGKKDELGVVQGKFATTFNLLGNLLKNNEFDIVVGLTEAIDGQLGKVYGNRIKEKHFSTLAELFNEKLINIIKKAGGEKSIQKATKAIVIKILPFKLERIGGALEGESLVDKGKDVLAKLIDKYEQMSEDELKNELGIVPQEKGKGIEFKKPQQAIPESQMPAGLFEELKKKRKKID